MNDALSNVTHRYPRKVIPTSFPSTTLSSLPLARRVRLSRCVTILIYISKSRKTLPGWEDALWLSTLIMSCTTKATRTWRRALQQSPRGWCAGRKCQTRKMPDSALKVGRANKENEAKPPASGFSDSLYLRRGSCRSVSLSRGSLGAETPFDIQTSTLGRRCNMPIA